MSHFPYNAFKRIRPQAVTAEEHLELDVLLVQALLNLRACRHVPADGDPEAKHWDFASDAIDAFKRKYPGRALQADEGIEPAPMPRLVLYYTDSGGLLSLRATQPVEVFEIHPDDEYGGLAPVHLAEGRLYAESFVTQPETWEDLEGPLLEAAIAKHEEEQE